ncbi:MAG: PcfJ domain-containing protein [Treponema sp.]|nr:PcfJ domain-containing protein [Treponema sp.]
MKSLSPFWALNIQTGKIEPANQEPLSVFPTIVNSHNYTVWCKRCKCWEKILGFQKNLLKSQCGQIFSGPFISEKSTVTYGYVIGQKGDDYSIKIKNIFTSTQSRKSYENIYELRLSTKRFYRNGQTIIKSEDVNVGLSESLSQVIENIMAEKYKRMFGIKPTVSSKLCGFQRLVGYMLCPFNVNFYQICQHWGLNPYDKNFTSLSSGNSPTAENEMFQCLGLKASKSIRKLYQEKPYSVVCYSVLKDLGITDVNIQQKSATETFYSFIKSFMISFAGGEISYPLRDNLKCFCQDILEINGNNQKALWNCLERTASYRIGNGLAGELHADQIIADSLNSYPACREQLENSEKLDILHEGFNNYTHDFLVRRIHQERLYNNNNPSYSSMELITFEIESQFLDLEYKCGENFKKCTGSNGKEEYIRVEDKNRYCFYVARDNLELKHIGAAMNNCVGWGYTNSVAKRKCTIVYAKYRGKFRICIEVSPDFHIRQALGPCNQPLDGDALEAYHEWCKNKNIEFTKAFRVRLAPE